MKESRHRFKNWAVLVAICSALIPALAWGACAQTPRPAEITILTEDGFRLAATEYGRGENGVILAHNFDGSRFDWHEFAELLASARIRAIAVSFRGFDGSDGVRDFAVMERDLIGAARYLQRERSVKKIGYVGVGTGGTIVFKAAANPDLQPTVIESVSPVPHHQGLDASRYTVQLFMPKLIVESSSNPGALAAVQELYKTLPEPKRFEEVSEPSTGMSLVNSAESARLRTEMVDYLKKGFE